MFDPMSYEITTTVFGCDGDKFFNLPCEDSFHSYNNMETSICTFETEGNYTVTTSVQCLTNSGWVQNSCKIDLQVYDPNTQLECKLFFPSTVNSSINNRRTIVMTNGVSPYRWVIDFYNTLTHQTYSINGVSTTKIISTSYNLLNLPGDYVAKVFVSDGTGEKMLDTVSEIIKVPYEFINSTQTFLTYYYYYYYCSGCPTYFPYYFHIVEKGNSFRSSASYHLDNCSVDRIKFYKSYRLNPYILTSSLDVNITSDYMTCYEKYVTFRFEDFYSIKIKTFDDDNSYCNDEDVRYVVSINSNSTKHKYYGGVLFHDNYYAGIFDLNDPMPKNKDVHLLASNKIILNKGFKTQAGKKFSAHANIFTCKSDYKASDTITAPKNYFVKSDFTIIPNPNTGNFTIDLSNVQEDITKIEIYNQLGVCIYTITKNLYSNQEVSLNVSYGIYLVNVYTENKILSKKMIIN